MIGARFLLLAALGAVVLAGTARASAPPSAAYAAARLPLAAQDGWVGELSRAGEPGSLFQRALEPPAEPSTPGEASRKPLKPGTAVLLSALVPGSSQIHDRSVKGYVMLGLEVGLWFTYQGLHSGGQDRQASAANLAAAAYSVDTYRANALASGNVDQATIDRTVNQLRDWQQHSPSDFLDAIAREPGLVYGWSDYGKAGSGASADHEAYVKRRDDGNRLLQHANTILSGVLLNHIISAFDAFRNARKLQRELPGGVSMRMDLRPFSGKASLVLSRKLW